MDENSRKQEKPKRANRKRKRTSQKKLKDDSSVSPALWQPGGEKREPVGKTEEEKSSHGIKRYGGYRSVDG